MSLILSVFIICIAAYAFLSLHKFYRRYDKKISEDAHLLIKRKFFEKEYTVVKIESVKDSDLIPFNTNRFRIVFNAGAPFNNEYYFKIKTISSRGNKETFWVHIEYLFKKPIGFIVKNNQGDGVSI